jgi:hypothetical protein
MSLSNEERLGRIWVATLNISRIGREFDASDPHRGYNRLKTLTENIWHAFLKGAYDGGLWLFGAHAENTLQDLSNPWSAAIALHCEASRDSLPMADPEAPTDPLKTTFSITSLLQIADNDLVRAYHIQIEAERLAYALRRYDDDFRRQYPALDAAISDIQGACFDIFRGENAVAKAYVGNRILNTLWNTPGFTQAFEGIAPLGFTQFMERETTLSTLLEWNLRLAQEHSLVDCILIAAQMCNLREEHHVKRLLKNYPFEDTDQQTLLLRVEQNRAQHQQRQDSRQEDYTQQALYNELEILHGSSAAFQIVYEKPE